MLNNVLTLLTILPVFMHVKGEKKNFVASNTFVIVNYEYLNAKIIMYYSLAFISIYSYCVFTEMFWSSFPQDSTQRAGHCVLHRCFSDG